MKVNKIRNNIIYVILGLMAAAAFAIYFFPNHTASENLSMIQMFEPDEAAPLPSVFDMIAPADNLDKALRQFIFYEYYFYGFPYFAYSALVVLPLQLLGKSSDLSMVMAALRQFVSVIPAILGLLRGLHAGPVSHLQAFMLFGILLAVRPSCIIISGGIRMAW